MTDKQGSQQSTDFSESRTEPISEIEEDLIVRHRQLHLFPRAALVGLGTGLVATLFRAVLAGADTLRNNLLAWAQEFPRWGWIYPLAFSMTGAVLSFVLVIRLAPETSGSGIPQIKAVVRRLRTLRWKRVLPVKFVSGALAIGSGLALGREGPTVQIGGAVGTAVASWFKAPPREQRTLTTAGAGAGLAAAFNAPLAGVMFALEEIRHDFHPSVFGAAFLAAAIADIVVRFFCGGLPVLVVPNYSAPPMTALPVCVLLGLFAGLLGVVFNRGLLATLTLFERLSGRRRLGIAAAMGAITGVVGWFSPMVIGGGQSLAVVVLAGKLALTMIPLFFVTRFLMTISSYGTGVAGGIFSPLLALGALIGLATGQIAHYYTPAIAPDPGAFAVIGMAAYFAAIVRAPLTSVVLIIEMTGDYQQMLPLLVSCFCAYAVAELLNDPPIYEALLERDPAPDDGAIQIQEPMVVDFEIEPNAPFAGREVSKLGLPPGCLLVRCFEGGREFVPTARTILEAYMRITVFIAPEASAGLTMLRNGCKGKRLGS